MYVHENRSVAQLLVESAQWEEAHELMKTRPEVKEIVMMPYATWLALQVCVHRGEG